MKAIFYRTTLIWLGMFCLAFLNGAIRELVIKKFLDESGAHQLSCITGAILWTILVWFFWNKTLIKNSKEAMFVGLYWFLLTLFTETLLLNRLIGEMTWEQILNTYNIFKGQYWGLVLIWVGILPITVRFFKTKNF